MVDEADAQAFLETLCQADETGFLKVGGSIAPQISDPVKVIKRFADSDSSGRGSEIEQRLKFMGTIGEGGMGLVRLAEQRSLGREVAVKGLRPDRESVQASASLLSEAWITGAVEHPNVIPVHDLGLDEAGRPIVIMKRVRGVEWFDLMNDAKTVEERFGATGLLEWNVTILLQVINAVRLAHSRHIVHRDLKPSNVMIGEFGEVYVVDWGIAMSVATGDERPNSDTPSGTPGYMAPEMLHCGEIGPHTDIYLVGAMLFEIATGRLPHQARTVSELIASIENSPPSVPYDVPEEIAAICTRAMAAEPADRYEDLEQLQRALQQFLDHRGSAQLASRAAQRLHDLRACIERLQREERLDDAASEGVYSLFSECRFAFREALSGWPDNRAAKNGLRQALQAMIEFELANDSPRAAQNLLSELAEEDMKLRARVETAVSDEALRLARLESLRELHDESLGAGARSVLFLSMFVAFCVVPLSVGFWARDIRSNHMQAFLASLALLVFALVVVFATRKTMLTTALNRRLAGTAIVIPITQMALAGGAAILQLPERVFVIVIFCWFVIAAMFAISTSAFLLIAPVGYLIAFFVSAYKPEWVFYAMAMSNAVMLLNMLAYSMRRYGEADR